MELEKIFVGRDIVGQGLVPAPGIPSPVNSGVIETVADVRQVARLARIGVVDQEAFGGWGPGPKGASKGCIVLTAYVPSKVS